MATWAALLVAPLLTLAQLMIAYGLAVRSCEQQQPALGHWASLAMLLAALALTALANARRRSLPQPAAPLDADAEGTRPRFTATVAVWAGALSALVIAALWLPQWLLSPCAS